MNVYDFDNTIFDGESCILLYGFYLKKKPGLIRFIPAVVRAVVKYRLGLISTEEMQDKYVGLIDRFLQEAEDAPAVIKAFWDKYEKRIKPFYLAQQRPDDVILTASPALLIEEIAKRLGIQTVIGTRVDEETMQITFMCYGENKITAFREVFPTEEIDSFYTDSESDRPVMALAKHAYFVKKNEITQVK